MLRLPTLFKALTWPFRALARVRGEGLLFIGLAGLLAALSIFSASEWSNVPLLMCLMLVSLWLLAMWQGTRTLRGLQIRRSHIERVFANEPVTVLLQISNDSTWPSAGLTFTEQLEADEPEPAPPPPGSSGSRLNSDLQKTPSAAQRPVAPRLVAAQGGAFVTVVPGHGQERARYTIAIRRRGIYRFSNTRIDSDSPMGFFHSTAARHVKGRLVVYPRMGEVSPVFFEELDLAFQFMRHARPSRAEEDFRGLREYRQGDNPKWIHWKSTARLQRTLVKEWEEPQARRVLVLLDTNLLKLGMQRFPAFEAAISFAGTMARDLARRGCEVEFAALQPQNRLVRMVVSRERRNLDVLFESLAGLRREDRRTLAGLSEHIGRRNLHQVFVVVLGLGSLRAKVPLNWLNTGDNAVKVVDVRREEFRRIFSRSTGSGKDDLDDDLMTGPDEEDVEEELSAAQSAS